MLASDLVDVLRSVAETDPTTCDSAGLETVSTQVHRLRCWLDSIDAAVVARRRELAAAGGRRSSREADVVSERATVCEAMPEVRSALAAGTVSAGHADAIARACNRLDVQERAELATMAPELVTQAASTSVDAFARHVRDLARRISHDEGLRHHEKLRSQRAVRRWMDREGMCHTQISLDPEADATVVGRVRRRRRRREGQARRSTVRSISSRPTRSWPSSPRRAVAGITASGRAARAHRPRDAPHRPPRVQRLRDVRRPAPPTGNGEAAGVRGGDHPRSCWTARAESSTSAEPNGWRQPTNDEHSEPCTRPAPHPTAPSASATATSTTSPNGSKEATRTSPT